ncbi:alkene reductase [Rhizobium sp. Root1204]|uniref:alkene reductase n=1 Tax=Rhizobium sp. Root1204 TaxID=1736428 RepID=UPI00071350B7|nr:alkene reductase [Rhizobium sp. Root1204]KQV36993.1 hypothetical protein ASC96_26580 [Rhizobium sp. Root1204]
MTVSLFDAAKLGEWTLANRMVMAPMTRSRAGKGWVPSVHAAQYYGQRASAGLVITEATQVCRDATGYSRTPGVWSSEQTEAWRAVAAAIHEGGAKAVMQLWHTGRMSHPLNLPEGCEALAPSSIAADMPMWTDQEGFQPCATPREMTAADIERVIRDFATAAANAISAGFDGVELHAANGYLIDQFSNSASNRREDEWGGSLQNRVKFYGKVIEAVASAVGKDRTGVRLSPYGTYGDVSDNNPKALLEAQVDIAATADLAYLHIIRPMISGAEDVGATAKDREVLEIARRRFPNTLIAAGGYSKESATVDLNEGLIDLVAFGKPFIANPDLPARLKAGQPLSDFNGDLLYAPGPEGYSDYPALNAQA